MVDRRIRKIRNNAISLAISGTDILFIAETPDDPVGQGAVYLFGNEASPTTFLCARRCLNELKHHLKKAGYDLEYSVTAIDKEADDE